MYTKCTFGEPMLDLNHGCPVPGIGRSPMSPRPLRRSARHGGDGWMKATDRTARDRGTDALREEVVERPDVAAKELAVRRCLVSRTNLFHRDAVMIPLGLHGRRQKVGHKREEEAS